MYSLLIVDDESWIRRGIRARLQDHGFHFSAVYEAGSGAEALELMTEHRPDILLLDVKMDGMDGVEVMSRLKQMRLEPKTVVISGYSEFGFVEQAINFGARGYLLKPIDSQLFVQRIQAVIIELEQERGAPGLPSEVLRIIPTAESEPYGLTSEFTDSGFVALGIIHVDNVDDSNWVRNVRAKQAIRRRLAETLTRVLSDRGVSLFDDTRSESNLVFLCGGSSADQVSKSTRRSADVALAHARSLGYSVSIGCSDPSDQVVPSLYTRARHAVDRRLTNGTNAVYPYRGSGSFRPVPRLELGFLEQHVLHRNAAEIRRRIRSILSPADASDLQVSYLHDAYLGIVQTTTRALGSQPRHSTDAEPFAGLDEVLDSSDNLEQFAERVSSIIESMVTGDGANQDQDRIDRICDYIRQHFAEELSTQLLAKEFSINANYLSTLFRSRTGVTVTGYIRDVRMNAACRLLSETAMNVSEVAESVGYFDPKYFYRVFKRVKGFTPGEIRSGFRGESEKDAPLT